MVSPTRRELLVLGGAGLAHLLFSRERADAATGTVLETGFVDTSSGAVGSASSLVADPSLSQAGIRVTLEGRVPVDGPLRFLDVRVVMPSDPPVEFHAWGHDGRNEANVSPNPGVGFFLPLTAGGALRLIGEAQYLLPGRAGQVVGTDEKPLYVKRPFTANLSLGGGRGPKLRTGTFLLSLPPSATGQAPAWNGLRFGEVEGAGGGRGLGAGRRRTDGAIEPAAFPYLVLTVEKAPPETLS